MPRQPCDQRKPTRRTFPNRGHAIAPARNGSTAEHNAERGRVGTALLNAMLIERQQRFAAHGIYARNERVASEENDIADLLSRGSIEAALQFPLSAGLKCVELEVPPSLRAFPSLGSLSL